jgi:choline-sulfatase
MKSQSAGTSRALAGRVAVVALADAALAGAAAAAIDLSIVLSRVAPSIGGVPGTALVVLGLTVFGVALTGAPLVLLVRLLARHPTIRSFTSRLAAPGPDRVHALVELAVVLAVLVGLWGLAFVVSRFAHGAYNSSTGIALMTATAALGAQVAAVLLATAVTPSLARRLAARPALIRATSGWTMPIVAGCLLVLALLAGDHLLQTRFHSWDPVPAYLYGLATIAVVVAAIARPTERLGRRGLGVAVGLAVVVAAAVAAVGAAPVARGAIANGSVLARGALRSLQRVSDRDGDGYAGRFGGSDCDDSDPAVNPVAEEIAGNRRDDNCAGGDAAPAAASPPAAPTPGGRPRNVLLITVDTVRADHTSLYGYARPTTPVLAEIAARGVRFERAVAASPTTRQSLPALLFGRYPSRLPFDPASSTPRLLDHSLPTLASILAGAGYRTHALFAVGEVLNDEALVGFASTDSVSLHGRGYKRPNNAVEVTDRALAWIGKPAPEPWFLWIHYFDPHHPYQVPVGAPKNFGDEPLDRYDAEIAHADAQIGRLVAGMKPAGETLLVVTADHGEAFGERGVHFHGKNLHEEQTRVPLVMALLGGAPLPGRVETTPVSLVDVTPTVLDLTGASQPAGMNGRSLAPVVLGVGSAPARPIVMELMRDRFVSRRMLGVIDGDHKIVWDLDADATSVFDLRRDPGEHDDLIATPVGDTLRATLGATLDRELGARP